MKIIVVSMLCACCIGCMTTSRAQLDSLVGGSIERATMALGKAPSASVGLGTSDAYSWRWPLHWTKELHGTLQYEIVTLWARDGIIFRWQRRIE